MDCGRQIADSRSRSTAFPACHGMTVKE